jgi:hypothetical protein
MADDDTLPDTLPDPLLGTLLDLERRGWTALCDGTAADFYAGVMAADGLMVLANGAVMGRDAVVAALGGSPPWADWDMDDVELVPAGRDAAALVYRARARRDGAPEFTGAMTSLYVRSGDGWRLALYTQTPVT